MILAIIVFGIFLLVVGAIKDDSDFFTFLGVVGILSSMGMGIAISFSISDNANDLATLRKYDPLISVQQEKIDRLEKILGKHIPVDTKQGNWASADTPNASLIESYTDAVNSLAHAQSQKAWATVNIESRKDGMFWFVVSIYGDH